MDAAKAESRETAVLSRDALLHLLAALPTMEELPGVEYAMRLGLERVIRAARTLVNTGLRAGFDPHECPDDARTDEEKFNPALRAWLNARDRCSDDWPYNVDLAVLLEADFTFGEGYILDEYGWPIRKPTHAYVSIYYMGS